MQKYPECLSSLQGLGKVFCAALQYTVTTVCIGDRQVFHSFEHPPNFCGETVVVLDVAWRSLVAAGVVYP